jgi:hypothetical protein
VTAAGYAAQMGTWETAGRGISAAGDDLASAVDRLCHTLAGAGDAWGQDDIGRAFFNGGEQKPGFGAVRDQVLAGLADMVNLLRATGGTLRATGRVYGLAEEAGAAPPADAGSAPYTLPAVVNGLAHSDPPPPAVQRFIGFLQTLVGGCQWPDGDMAGLASIQAAFSSTAGAILPVAGAVDGHSRTVTANNAGETVDRFATFAAALRGGGEEGGLLWLAGMCTTLAESVGFLMKQENAARLQFVLSCEFLILTWAIAATMSAMTAGTSVAEAEAVTVAEGSALRSFLGRVAKAVGAGIWFAGGMDGVGQYARVHDGVQKKFDGGEFLAALGEGAIAGGVMGYAGARVAARGTRLSTALADWMRADGVKGISSRFLFAGTTGTAGNVAAQGLVEQHVDLTKAAEFGFGMAAIGATGEVGKHVLGQNGRAAPAGTAPPETHADNGSPADTVLAGTENPGGIDALINQPPGNEGAPAAVKPNGYDHRAAKADIPWGRLGDDGIRRFDNPWDAQNYELGFLRHEMLFDVVGETERDSVFTYVGNSWPYNDIARRPPEAGSLGDWWGHAREVADFYGRAEDVDTVLENDISAIPEADRTAEQHQTLASIDENWEQGIRPPLLYHVHAMDALPDLSPAHRAIVDDILSHPDPAARLEQMRQEISPHAVKVVENRFGHFPNLDEINAETAILDRTTDHPLPEGLEVTRSLSSVSFMTGFDPMNPHDLRALVGTVQVEPALMSTRHGDIGGWADRPEEYPYQLHLEVPAGTRGVWLGGDQRELLLARKMRYLITDANSETGELFGRILLD